MLNIIKLKLNDNKPSNILSNRGDILNQAKHYPPATREWLNSIYSFNKSTTRLLPVFDIVIIKLIKSYFSLYSRKLEKKLKYAAINTRKRRSLPNRIIVSKADIKHTNDKVFITLYLYNRQKTYYLHNTKKISFLGFNVINLKLLIKYIKICLINMIDLKINFFNKTTIYFKYLKSLKKFLGLKQNKFKDIKKKSNFFFETINYKMKLIKKESSNVIRGITKEKNTLLEKLSKAKTSSDLKGYEKIFVRNFISKYLEKGLLYMYYKQLLFLNRSKFNYTYILPLKNIMLKVYKKKIEFNLVTLKYIHLNSDIFTQILVLKLKNRKNRILGVLKTSLRTINLPVIKKFLVLNEVFNRKNNLKNLIIKELLNDPLLMKKDSSDILNNILKNSLPISLDTNFKKHLENIVLNEFSPYNIRREFKKFLSSPKFNSNLPVLVKKEYDKYYKNIVLDSLKYKVVNGIRIEAAGRLTRRITAARSIFKLRYKGNIKNIDSSFKGFSSVILRGHFKPNLQYTKLASKTRIGSFGLKG